MTYVSYRTIEKYTDTEMSRFAGYCQTSLLRTKKRDFAPSRNEVIACLGRRDLNATVFCYGGGQCTININPSTTAGEVSGCVVAWVIPYNGKIWRVLYLTNDP